MTAEASISRARLVVGGGPLARPLAARLVMALGAQTTLPVDRVDEAALLAESIAELRRDEVELTVRADPDGLELRVGPMGAGEAQRLLEEDARRASGGIIPALASSVAVREARDRDTLVVTVTVAG